MNATASPPRIFVDSSVLFAAAVSATGASRALILLAEIGLVRLIVCPLIFEEVERNLKIKAPEALPFFRRLQDALHWELVSDPTLEEVRACLGIIAAKDAPILAAALKANPHRLITLDTRHFNRPEVRKAVSFSIQTPGEFLTDIRKALITALIPGKQT